MVVSLNRGTPNIDLIYYSPYYRDPQKGTPSFGKVPNRFGVSGIMNGFTSWLLVGNMRRCIDKCGLCRDYFPSKNK